MKRQKSILANSRRALAGLVAALLVSTAGGSDLSGFQAVIGSGHDLSANPGFSGGRDACAYCHLVDAESGEVLAGLNRSDPVSAIVLYDDERLSTEITGLAAVSSHCMSCHDGETALDALGGAGGTEGLNMRSVYPDSPSILGPDLNVHHPTGVRFPDHYEYAELAAVDQVDFRLFEGKLECPTCHEVHGRTGLEKFLVRHNDSTSLCLICHRK